MKKYLFIIASLVVITLHAQESRQKEYFPQGTVWSYYMGQNQKYSFSRQIVDGEETINGKVYKKIYSMNDCTYDPQTATLAGYIREENQKVFTPTNNDNNLMPVGDEYLLYDFTLSIGDTVRFENKYGGIEKHPVRNVYTMTTAADNTERRVIEIDNNIWIEGLGAINQLFFNPLGDIPTIIGPFSMGTLNVFNAPNGYTIYRAPYIECQAFMYYNEYQDDCLFNPKDKKAFYSYQPVIKQTEEYEWVYSGLNPNEAYYYKQFISAQSTTIINGFHYYDVYESNCDGSQKKRLGGIREQDKQIYYLAEGDEQEQLLYDFNLKAGDKITYQYHGNPSEWEVLRIDTIECGKTMRRQYTFKSNWSENGEYWEHWIEGIGNEYDLLTPLHERPTMIGAPMLNCVHYQDQVLYPANAESCNCRTSSVRGKETIGSYRILQNPIVDKILSIEFNESGFTGLKLYDYEGKLCLSQPISQHSGILNISLNHLSKGNYILILDREDYIRESTKIRIE